MLATTLETLAVFQKDINRAMEAYFEANGSHEMAPHSLQAYKFLREFSSRPGKRIRGALAMVAYKMFDGPDHRTALNLAIAVELIQNYLLIIDDVMDRSEKRRGAPTIHEEYLKVLPKNFAGPEARHLSNMLGVSVGVIAQHMASELLASQDAPPANLRQMQMLFHKNILATCYGQVEDLFNNAMQDAAEDAIIRTYILKNSYYTFINPLQCGAALAGADDKTLALISRFGIHAGVAFQLQDDIIGMFGDEKQTGKSAMDDLREGKMTVLIHHGLANGDKEQVANIRAALGNSGLTAEQHDRVRATLKAIGSYGYVADMAKHEVAEALRILGAFKSRPGYEFLRGLLDYIIEREN
ncbi:MAG TPA: polyprenyl synthetase family protein [Candidatus Saccharimonadales bacterium]|nr:polyprenyl synthetase family protein [Candidatus Saccharimonadales bacterium]